MNSVLLLNPEHTIVVDPGVLPSEIDELAARTARAAPRHTALFFTHAHWDHVLGRAWWPDARTLGHARMAQALARDVSETRAEAKHVAERLGERWPRDFEPFRLDESLGGFRSMELDPWRLAFRDAPGHCESSLTLHLPDRGLLIAGDLASDTEIPGLDGSPEVYRRTLEDLLPLVEGGAIETLVPGHGSIARGREAVAARLHGDLAYLSALEQAVRVARRDGAGIDEVRARLASMPIVGRDDPEVPTGPVHDVNVTHAFRAATGVAAGPRHRS